MFIWFKLHYSNKNRKRQKSQFLDFFIQFSQLFSRSQCSDALSHTLANIQQDLMLPASHSFKLMQKHSVQSLASSGNVVEEMRKVVLVLGEALRYWDGEMVRYQIGERQGKLTNSFNMGELVRWWGTPVLVVLF